MEQNISNLFPQGELKDLMNELIVAAEALSKREPKIGFHHSFYVPGWIGAIQEMVVNSQMQSFEALKFYNEKNYTDFAQWIIDSSAKVAELHKESKPEDGDEKAVEEYNSQSDAIVKVFTVLIEVWLNCAPEVATMFNRVIDSNTRMSLYGIVYQNVAHSLRDFGFRQVSDSPKEKGFAEEGKDMLYRIAGMFINIMILGLIGLIISAIAG